MLFYAQYMTLTEAVRELRRISGKNQQYFATELDMSTRVLQQYEAGKTPGPKQLLWFAAYADKVNKPEIARLFQAELQQQLKPPPDYYVELSFGPIKSRRNR
jgi:transcriptional regulator with XRE-family HTH domain